MLSCWRAIAQKTYTICALVQQKFLHVILDGNGAILIAHPDLHSDQQTPGSPLGVTKAFRNAILRLNGKIPENARNTCKGGAAAEAAK